MFIQAHSHTITSEQSHLPYSSPLLCDKVEVSLSIYPNFTEEYSYISIPFEICQNNDQHLCLSHLPPTLSKNEWKNALGEDLKDKK